MTVTRDAVRELAKGQILMQKRKGFCKPFAHIHLKKKINLTEA